MSLKIAVYAIAKNETQFIERFLEAAKDADLIMVADTGSTDGTLGALLEARDKRPRGAVDIREVFVDPWRFDMARDAVLAMIPRHIDVCVSLDLDEILQPGWRAEIERVWKVGETTRLRYGFDWGAGIVFQYEKIHARHGYRWHHPCHEYPMPYGITEVWADTDFLMVVHKADPTKSRHGYLPLLKMSIEEDPHCPRNAFFYARELSFGYPGTSLEECIVQCDRYLSLPRATWPNERCYAYRVKGEALQKLGRTEEAITAFYKAAQEAPETREPWVALANVMYELKRWYECYVFAKVALDITFRPKLYTVDPAVWKGKPELLACIGAWNVGMKHDSLLFARRALELDPENSLYQENLTTMTKLMES